jgi:hypothetical protein
MSATKVSAAAAALSRMPRSVRESDGGEDRLRAVEGRDAGGDPVPGVEVVGERGGRRVQVDAGQQAQADPVAQGAGHGQAEPPAGVPDHEVDGLRGDLLGRDDDVALVLPVLVVDQDDHPPGPELLDGLLDRAEPLGRVRHR